MSDRAYPRETRAVAFILAAVALGIAVGACLCGALFALVAVAR